MCDTQTLGKLFLWGGYCYKHFHPTTTAPPTTRPTTTPPTTSPPTTPPSCIDCVVQQTPQYLFSDADLKMLDDGKNVSIPGTFFTSDNACGETFEIVVTAVQGGIECDPECRLTDMIVTLSYLGTGASATMTITPVQFNPEGGLCMTGTPPRICVDPIDTMTGREFQAQRPCVFVGIRLDNIVVDCQNLCGE